MNHRSDVTENPFPERLADGLARAGVIAVLVVDEPSSAVPLAKCLADAGIQAIELALRTRHSLECLARIREAAPEMLVGAGTVLDPRQVAAVAERGADFAVAPGFNPRILSSAVDLGLPFAPGVCTPSEIELAAEQGCRLLKFFPSEPMGGLAYLKSAAGPYRHLGLRFIPLGGITLSNVADYLEEPLVHSIGGSWIAPVGLIRERNWRLIAANVEECMTVVERLRTQRDGER